MKFRVFSAGTDHTCLKKINYILRYFIVLCMLSLPLRLYAYSVSGIVVDMTEGTPVANAIIVDASEGTSATTDARGYFTIVANTGDKLECTAPGYQKETLFLSKPSFMTIKLKIKSIALQDFVLTDLTPFQQDSIAMHKLYQQELEQKSIKPQYTGLGVNNLFSSLAYAVSKKHKQNKAFKAEFKNDEQQKFIATRYTAALTGSLTGLAGDTLARFMNTHPMDYSFARRATNLELKMWIRDNYKQYRKQLSPAPADSTAGAKHRKRSH